MNNWMHCNKCGSKYNPGVKLTVTECGHLLCQRCTENLKDSICSVCNKLAKIIPLSDDMDASVQQYFIPFEEHLKKLIDVYNFQMKQRERLFQSTLHKYNYAKNECILANNKYKRSSKENQILKSALMSGGRIGDPRQFSTSTPLVNGSQADNMSLSSISNTPSIRQGLPTGFAARPGVAQRIQSRNNNFRGVHLPLHLNSGGSSFTRPSPAHLVPNMERNLNIAPVHRPSGSKYSMEQLRRMEKRT